MTWRTTSRRIEIFWLWLFELLCAGFSSMADSEKKYGDNAKGGADAKNGDKDPVSLGDVEWPDINDDEPPNNPAIPLPMPSSSSQDTRPSVRTIRNVPFAVPDNPVSVFADRAKQGLQVLQRFVSQDNNKTDLKNGNDEAWKEFFEIIAELDLGGLFASIDNLSAPPYAGLVPVLSELSDVLRKVFSGTNGAITSVFEIDDEHSIAVSRLPDLLLAYKEYVTMMQIYWSLGADEKEATKYGAGVLTTQASKLETQLKKWTKADAMFYTSGTVSHQAWIERAQRRITDWRYAAGEKSAQEKDADAERLAQLEALNDRVRGVSFMTRYLSKWQSNDDLLSAFTVIGGLAVLTLMGLLIGYTIKEAVEAESEDNDSLGELILFMFCTAAFGLLVFREIIDTRSKMVIVGLVLWYVPYFVFGMLSLS